MVTFKDLPLTVETQKALEKLGFTTPTDIQAQAIPVLKQAKIDFHGQAQTGTGKTVAFGIPLIEQVEGVGIFPEGLVIAPTRELVVQIVDSLKALASFRSLAIEAIYGGVSIVQQEKALRKGSHIIVGTPGRLLDHLNKGTLKLHKLKTVVLDEADVMLDMGFKEDIETILKRTPHDRNIWLFSATVKPGINDLKISHMKNPVEIRVACQQVTTDNTKQYYAIVAQKDRLAMLARYIEYIPDIYGIIFTPTKLLADQISKALSRQGHHVEALHGDMGQHLRNDVIKRFKEKKINLLVATDVAARGIDVVGLTHVINYALPREQENYVHRIGRTGRAGSQGVAITFIAHHELQALKRLARKFKADIAPFTLPTVQDVAHIKIEKVTKKMKSVCEKTVSLAPALADPLRESLQQYSQQQLIQGIINVLASDLHVTEQPLLQQPKGLDQRQGDSNLQELMINIGTIDRISKTDLLKFIIVSAKLHKNDIKRFRVILKRTYISVDPDKAEDIALALQAKKFGGRSLQIQFVNK